MNITLSKSLLGVAFAGTIMFASCSPKGTAQSTGLVLDSISEVDSAIVLAQYGDSLSATLDYKFHLVFPTGPDSLNKAYITNVLGKEYVGLSAQEIRAKYRANIIDVFKEEYKGLDADDLKSVAMSQRECYFSTDTICSEDKFFSVRIAEEVYQGGAHPMPTITCYNFDPQSGKLITESDLFIPGYQEKLGQKIKEALQPEYGDMLFSDQIEPNGNFLLTKQGVIYVYNPYDITPYAAGSPSVLIPWGELSDILKPYSLGEAYL